VFAVEWLVAKCNKRISPPYSFMRCVRTSEGSNEIRIDGLGVKSNATLLSSDEAARPNSDPAADRWSGWHRYKHVSKYLRSLLY
jgi:hypothetical protein